LEIANAVDVESTLPPRQKSLVFVSHDSRDAEIAEAFANLLSDVSAGTLKSFRSSDKKGNSGIEFGAEWYTSIMSQLGEATDVVALLTARSIDRPWILYEAGVAKGKLETTVLGLALGVPLDKVSTGPFGQFQNCGDDEDSLTKLVMQLLQRNPDAAPREAAVRRQVSTFMDAISKIPAHKPKKLTAEVSEEQNIAKLFEEVKAMVRELPDRIDDRIRTVSRKWPGRGGRKVHPGMLEELFARASTGDTKKRAAGLLLVLSFIRDELPWLNEVGMEVYRAISSGNRDALLAAQEQFHVSMEVMGRSKWARPEDEESYVLMRYVPEFLERFIHEQLRVTPMLRRKLLKAQLVAGPDHTS
jgi:hypothetical protein